MLGLTIEGKKGILKRLRDLISEFDPPWPPLRPVGLRAGSGLVDPTPRRVRLYLFKRLSFKLTVLMWCKVGSPPNRSGLGNGECGNEVKRGF